MTNQQRDKRIQALEAIVTDLRGEVQRLQAQVDALEGVQGGGEAIEE